MTSRLSYNIHAQFVTDTPKLMKHLVAIRPAAVLVMDGLGLAREIKAKLPDTLVISRIYPDEDMQNRMSPEDWLKQRGPETEGGIYAYTTNEAGFSKNLIDWHIRLLELAIKIRTPLVIGNMSVGTPAPEDWAAGRKLLELLDQHRDLFILGLHEYACGVITSGFLGGYPDNAGVDPSIPTNAGKGKNLIPSANWPTQFDAAQMTLFHCGRFKFLVRYCQTIGLPPPRILLTEHGFDDVSDIKAWSDRLQMTPPFTSIRGWKSVQNQWRKWYDAQGWSPQRAMFEQLAYADRTIYQGSAVEAQLLYCWAGRPGYKWDQFDLSGADEFQGWLEKASSAPVTIAPAPVVINPPIPLDRGEEVIVPIIAPGAPWVLRAEPSLSGAVVGYLKDGETVKLYPATAYPNGGHNWYVCVRDKPTAGEAGHGWTAYPVPLKAAEPAAWTGVDGNPAPVELPEEKSTEPERKEYTWTITVTATDEEAAQLATWAALLVDTLGKLAGAPVAASDIIKRLVIVDQSAQEAQTL